MATKALNYRLSHVAKRGLAAQAAVKPAEPLTAPDITCTVMPNKIMVSSLDLGGPLSRVSVFFRVGPRNETSRNLGVCHVIRSMAGSSTQQFTGFAIVRNLQQNGLYFTCTGDREITAFHVMGSRNKINCALRYLTSVVSCPAFKPWQVKDNLPRLQYEIGCLSPQARTLDILHSAAFRSGLGNSLFIKKDQIGRHTSEMLDNFYREGFVANRAAVAGYNIHQKDLMEFAKTLELLNNDPLEGNKTYFGGEIRKNKDSYFAHVAIATQGAGQKDIKDALVYSVLQHAYGARPIVAWGGSPSPIYTKVAAEAPDAGVSCLNINYSDTGLFGVFISSSAKNAGKAVEAAYKVLKSGTVSDADVKRAKAILKAKILCECENTESLVEDMGVQSLFGSVIIAGPVLAEAIDKITTSEVSNAAKKVANGKFSLAAFGDLSEVPYLDEIK